jgi:integrase
VLTVLKDIELRGLRDTARRARQSCSRVFRHAIGLGYISRDLTIESRGLLEPPITQHYPGITDPIRLGELFRSIDGYTGRQVVAIALQLAPLFFVRPGELRQARWRQLDVPDALWHIPAECMKKRVPHLVPLCRQALKLLKRSREVSGSSEYLLPAQTNPAQPIAGNALNIALKRVGFSSREITPHGFRATASTLLSELGWRSEVIERQLAHADADRMRRIYNHAQYLTERRAMMQTWADYLDQLRVNTRDEAEARR